MSGFFGSIKDSFDAMSQWQKVAVGAVVVGGSGYLLLGLAKKVMFKQRRPYKTDYKPGVVYVYQFPRTAVIPSYSPFALKLETWLRMANIVYENVDFPMWGRSKEGTLPFVELNGVEYDDSTFIIRDLTKIFKKESIDGSLSAEQKAVTRAFEQMMDTSTFMSYGWHRVSEHFVTMMEEKYLGTKFPWYTIFFFNPRTLRLKILKNLRITGIGRHSPEEIAGIGLEDLRAISTYLSTKQFFHGDTPTRVDAFLFGYLAQIIYLPFESPHQKLLNTECRNIIRYCDRIKAKYWPDWDEICKTRALNTWKK